ncbi:MAG: transglycosylase SLT domain-containing protein [Candidatus Competibacteraceae bacterium]|nr:transglycosylase SLT domain-containing protein [Candidatus Competibacteraceae bacterium]
MESPSPNGARAADLGAVRSGRDDRYPFWRWGLFPIAFLVSSLAGDVGATESAPFWRERFQILERSLEAREPVDYSELGAYPLYPYLRSRDLANRLAEFPAAEVRDFLKAQAGSPPAEKLRAAWLRQLAAARRWRDYGLDAAPAREPDPALECWRRQALLETGQGEQALRDFESLWLRGAALPAACDPLIARWQQQGEPSAALLWRRFGLAMANRELRLARFLRAAMPAADQRLADLWLTVAAAPQQVSDIARFPENEPRIAPIIAEGLNRWGQRDPLAAAAALDGLKLRYPALAPQWIEVERRLALRLASDYHPAALARLSGLPEIAADPAVREWRVRVCLQANDWAAALRWLEQLPAPERDSPRWRYWRGRALERLGRGDEARQAYEPAASQRDYYGFLAADRLGKPYAITHAPSPVKATELEALLGQSPALQRAQEWYLLGREPEADAEWRQALQSFDRPALQRAAVLASRWGWHAQAISTLARAEAWDDLEIRFPLAYRDSVVASARASGLEAAWVYAVIRQESAFRPAARSPAGALGLMQMMPATGRDIARQSADASDGGPEELLQPEINIRLGARYLRHVAARLQDHPLLATAAYNAGPNKVARWLPAREPVAADLWAETIPYQETRSYVQRVLEYAVIYSWRLGESRPGPPLSARLKPVLPAPPATGASPPDAG